MLRAARVAPAKVAAHLERWANKNMKILSLLLTALAIASSLFASDKPTPPAGFRWVEYAEANFEIQFPSGWNTDKQKQGITQAIRISPESFDAKGFNTGFTMNYVSCSGHAEWAAAMIKVGDMMKSIRDAIATPTESRIKKSDDMLFMIVEGDRLIPDSPHPDQLYHTRSIVRAFPKEKVIYFYSFGSLATEWEEAWKVGKVMLNPIVFNLKE